MIFVKSYLLETGNKVVEKGWPTEAVGVVVRIDNKIQVFTSDVFSSTDVWCLSRYSLFVGMVVRIDNKIQVFTSNVYPSIGNWCLSRYWHLMSIQVLTSDVYPGIDIWCLSRYWHLMVIQVFTSYVSLSGWSSELTRRIYCHSNWLIEQ